MVHAERRLLPTDYLLSLVPLARPHTHTCRSSRRGQVQVRGLALPQGVRFPWPQHWPSVNICWEALRRPADVVVAPSPAWLQLAWLTFCRRKMR